MKSRTALLGLLLMLALVLSACDTSTPSPSPNTPAPAVTNTALAAPNTPTTLVVVATTTVAPAAPTSTAVTLDLPTATAPTKPSDTPTPSAALPTATRPSNNLIIYLDNDGQSIYTVNPDGSDRKLVTKIDKPANSQVYNMTGSRDGKYLSYALADASYTMTYYLVSGGKSTKLEGIASQPQWFYDYFLASGPGDASGKPGEIYRFDPTSISDPVNFKQDLGVRGGPFTLTPDGTQVVYVDEAGNIMGLGLSHMTEHQPYIIVKLNTGVDISSMDYFYVTQMAFAPDSIKLVFSGEQRKNVGASGNGERLWVYDMGASNGGKTHPQPLTDNGGRYSTLDFAGSTVVAASDFHISACAVGSALELHGLEPNVISLTIDLPQQTGDTYARILGLSVQPGASNTNPTLAYGIDTYSCADASTTPTYSPAAIYVWSTASHEGAFVHKVVDGSFPIWVSTSGGADATPTANDSSGELVFYLDNDGQSIYTMKTDGSDRKLLTKIDKTVPGQDVTGMSASRDGKYLAFAMFANSGDVAPLDTYLVSNGKVKKLEGTSGLPVWYGHRFAVNSSAEPSGEPGQLLVYDADGSDGPVGAGLGVFGNSPAWSPDGKDVLFLDSSYNIAKINSYPPPYGNYAAESVLKLNDKVSGTASDWLVNWAAMAPDRTLVFAGGKQGDLGQFQTGGHVWLYRAIAAGGKGVPQAVGDTGLYQDYALVGGNALVAYSTDHGGACGDFAHLRLLNISDQTMSENKLPGDAAEGRYNIFGLSPAPGQRYSYLFSSAPYTCDSQQTASSPASIYRWSGGPDGKGSNTKIGAGRFPVWVDSAAVIPPAPTLVPGESLPPTVTPGSSGNQLIFYLASDGRTIYTMKPDGSDAAKLVTKIDLKPGRKVTGMSASRDGEYLAYALTSEAGTRPQTDYYLVLNGKSTKIENASSLPRWHAHRFVAQTLPDSSGNAGELAVYEANKGNGFIARGLGVLGDDFAWYPDGSAIAYYDSESNIHRLNLADSKTSDLLTLNPDPTADPQAQWQLSSIAVAPDGRILFVGAQQKDLGLVGAGQKVWAYDAAGGKGVDGLVALTDEHRYLLSGFLDDHTTLLYEAEHGGACGSIPHFKTLDLSNSKITESLIPGNSPDGRYTMQGLSPAPSGSSFVYAVAAYNCDNTEAGPATIYRADGNASVKLGNGSFPVWIDTALVR